MKAGKIARVTVISLIFLAWSSFCLAETSPPTSELILQTKIQNLNAKISDLQNTIELQKKEIEQLKAICLKNGVDLTPKEKAQNLPTGALSQPMPGIFLGETLSSVEKQPTQVTTAIKEDLDIKKQGEFHAARGRFWQDFKNASTEVRKSEIFNKTARFTDEFFQKQNYKIINWKGVVTSLSTTRAGKEAWIKINSSVGGFKIEYHSETIVGGSDVYNQLLNFQEGENVVFSAIVTPDADTGIKERSLTEKGCLSEPEFKVQFTSISKLLPAGSR